MNRCMVVAVLLVAVSAVQADGEFTLRLGEFAFDPLVGNTRDVYILFIGHHGQDRRIIHMGMISADQVRVIHSFEFVQDLLPVMGQDAVRTRCTVGGRYKNAVRPGTPQPLGFILQVLPAEADPGEVPLPIA